MKTLYFLAPIIFALIIGFSTNLSYGVLEPNSGYSLEGSGFAVTEETIQTTDLDMFFSTEEKKGTRMKLSVDDGFVTLNNDDFVSSDISGEFLRDGRFLRLQGTAQDTLGDEISIRFFGRLVASTDDTSVYGFTGRLTHDGEENKIIYTAKISSFQQTVTEEVTSTTTEEVTSTTTEEKTDVITVHKLKGSSDPTSITYQEISAGGAYGLWNFYSTDRIRTTPGTTITFVNDDIVSHSVTSGAGLGQGSRYVIGSEKPFACEGESSRQDDAGDFSDLNKEVIGAINRDCVFAIDGRIVSGDILPGESWSVTLEEMGFYRIADVDYPWMSIVIYAFPPVPGSTTVGFAGNDQRGN